MVGRNTAFLIIIGAGMIAVVVMFMAQRPPGQSLIPTEPDSSRLLAPPNDEAAGQIAAIAQGIRVWPASSTARALLTPSKADQDMLDSMVLAGQFDSLLARARREPAFAHSLARALDQCTHEAEATKRLELLLRVNGDERDERAVEEFDATYAKCRGLGLDQMALRFELAEQSARAGVLQAQLYYPGYVSRLIRDGRAAGTPEAVEHYRINAAAFVLAAARSGDPEGIFRAWHMYQSGFLVPKDPVLAYRYAEKFYRLQPSPYVQDSLGRLASQMTPEQLRRARGP